MKPKKNCCTTIDVKLFPVTKQFILEHQLLENRVIAFSKDLKEGNWDKVHSFLRWQVDRFIPLHIGKEEQLFIQLARHLEIYDQKLPHLMEEHREEREKIEGILHALSEGSEKKVIDLSHTLIKGLADHVHDENDNVFPAAEAVLTPDQITELHRQMRKIGNV